MKKSLLILALFPFFCSFKKVQKKKIIEITVLKVGFDYMTPKDVDCDEFETAWGLTIDTVNATNNEQLKVLLDKASKAKPPTKYPIIDARAKIFVKYESGKVDTFCVGTSANFYYNGKMLDYGSKDLSNFMWDLPFNYK